jgi:hypothetical protein
VKNTFSGKNAVWYPDGDLPNPKPLISGFERDARVPDPRLRLDSKIWNDDSVDRKSFSDSGHDGDVLTRELEQAVKDFREGKTTRQSFDLIFDKFMGSFHASPQLAGWYSRTLHAAQCVKNGIIGGGL